MAATNIYALPPFWKKIKKKQIQLLKNPHLIKKINWF